MQPSRNKVNYCRFQEKFCGLWFMRFFWKNFTMKTLFFVLFFTVFAIAGLAQQDTALVNRINQMLTLTQKKDVEKIMDYTYPKLFQIAPRELMIAALKETYDSEEFSIEIDSIKVLTIFPVFVVEDTSYVKVRYTMLMRMKYKQPLDTSDMESKNMLVSMLEQKYGEGNVRFDAVANSLNISMKPDMVGIKDKTSNTWTFANLDDDNPALLEMLFSQAVRDKLKQYN